jgi:hypothetical protein
MRQMLFVVLRRTGWWLSRKWRGGFQQQIAELKGTNRDTAPTRKQILERIEDALASVYQIPG